MTAEARIELAKPICITIERLLRNEVWELFKVIKDKSKTVLKAMKALAGKQKMPEDNAEE